MIGIIVAFLAEQARGCSSLLERSNEIKKVIEKVVRNSVDSIEGEDFDRV